MNKKYKKKLQLFISFFRIGSFTIGGGYAMIPLIEKEIVEKRKWLSAKDFLEMLTISQTLPGVLAVNTALLIGYRINGFWGAIISCLGSVLPSFIAIILIAMFFKNYKDNEIVERIFKGIRPVIVALMAASVWKIYKTAKPNIWKTLIIIALTVLLWLGIISPILLIIATIILILLFELIINPNKKIPNNKF